MTGPVRHRPLARWVAEATEDAGTTGRSTGTPDGGTIHHVTGRVNDGAERADARTLPLFTDGGWRRTSVRAARPGVPVVRALALHHPGRAETYVELDDYGNPVASTPAGAELVVAIEELWESPPDSPETVASLGSESLELRYFLLHRLAAETDPPPRLFHTLPWDEFDTVVRSLLALLRTGPPAPPASGPLPQGPLKGQLRHWFTPAGIGLAGPLCVLEGGARRGLDAAVLNREARTLLTGLLYADHRRLPASTATLLAGLTELLAARDQLLQHSARVVAARLRNDPTTARQVSFSIRLHSELRALGRSEGRVRTHKESRRDGHFETRVWMSEGGQLKVTVRLPDVPDVPDLPDVADAADVPGLPGLPGLPPVLPGPRDVLAPVTLHPEGATPERYWVALRTRTDGLEGVLELRYPRGRFRIDADGPPVPFAALDSVPPERLLPSLRACSTPARRIWADRAATLPAGHSVRVALELFERERPR
ncbi:hypothetical protein [Streptomyces sp. SID1121]|uniref:hypothetical protein n=1 Tax=Streptomyces sp. SID1121 TaxID=3425888 RepID=UPI004056FCE4